jgi:hypothetical protein
MKGYGHGVAAASRAARGGAATRPTARRGGRTVLALVVRTGATPFFDHDRSTLPQAFQGAWCIFNSGAEDRPIIYRRGSCDDSVKVNIGAHAINSDMR